MDSLQTNPESTLTIMPVAEGLPSGEIAAIMANCDKVELQAQQKDIPTLIMPLDTFGLDSDDLYDSAVEHIRAEADKTRSQQTEAIGAGVLLALDFESPQFGFSKTQQQEAEELRNIDALAEDKSHEAWKNIDVAAASSRMGAHPIVQKIAELEQNTQPENPSQRKPLRTKKIGNRITPDPLVRKLFIQTLRAKK